MKRIDIQTKETLYPLIIGNTIAEKHLELTLKNVGITTKDKILIVTDDHVAPLYLDKVTNILNEFKVFSYVVKSGERAKSLEQAEQIIEFLIKKGFDRSSAIIALGGGVIGDLAGFVAAIFMRGISFVQFPTTILAHDSSVGGKVGINHSLGKNLIGAFYQPKLVFYDTSLLISLPKKEIRSGLSEVIKHGLIADKSFSQWLYQHAEKLLNLELDYINEALFKGIMVKENIVREDEKELGIRAVLNYGHTLAHPIETISDYKYSHGESVAIGMVFASHLAKRMGICSEDNVSFTEKLLTKYELPTYIPKKYHTDDLLEIMMRDKKFKNEQIRMVLPQDIGKVTIVENIEKELIKETMEQLKK